MNSKDLNKDEATGFDNKNENQQEINPVNESQPTDKQPEIEKVESETSKKADKEIPVDINIDKQDEDHESDSDASITEKEDAVLDETKLLEDNSEQQETPQEDTKLIEEVISEKEEEPVGTEIYNIPDNLATLEKEQLVEILQKLMEKRKMLEIREKVEEIKALFYRKHKEDVQSKKTLFIKDGGKEEEFVIGDDNDEIQFKELYKKYKGLKTAENIALEGRKEENLKEKYAIIEEIKNLINRKESFNKTFKEFKELQNKWRELGLVPQGELKNLWETYNYNVEKFYDFIKINKELRDLDLKKNLEAKIALCVKAESLLLETNIPKAFKELQEYHNSYREIGPAPLDKREEVWQRFKEATSIINKKQQEYYDNLKKEQLKNVEAKKELCDKVDEIIQVEYFKPKKWEEITKEVIEIQKLWKTIGYVSKKDNNRLYGEFKEKCDTFFQAKRSFYEKNKEEQKNNLHLKTDLCEKAETLKDSTDWKTTTQQLIDLQKNWKEIGPVPRKYSDSVWKRFRSACDLFFKNKNDFYSGLDGKQEDNLKTKQDLIEQVKSFKPSDDNNENLKILMEFQNKWTEIGYVPISEKENIQKLFRESISAHLENLNIDKDKRILINFKQKVEHFAATNAFGKIENETNKIVTKLRDLESEIALYENNIGFFAKSKNAEAMINEVSNKIEKAQFEKDILKAKLDILNKL